MKEDPPSICINPAITKPLLKTDPRLNPRIPILNTFPERTTLIEHRRRRQIELEIQGRAPTRNVLRNWWIRDVLCRQNVVGKGRPLDSRNPARANRDHILGNDRAEADPVRNPSDHLLNIKRNPGPNHKPGITPGNTDNLDSLPTGMHDNPLRGTLGLPQHLIQVPGAAPYDRRNTIELDRVFVVRARNNLSDDVGINHLKGEPEAWRIVLKPEEQVREIWVIVVRRGWNKLRKIKLMRQIGADFIL